MLSYLSICSRRSMDRTDPCGGSDGGSIPLESTNERSEFVLSNKAELCAEESKSGAGTSSPELVASCGHDKNF